MATGAILKGAKVLARKLKAKTAKPRVKVKTQKAQDAAKAKKKPAPAKKPRNTRVGKKKSVVLRKSTTPVKKKQAGLPTKRTGTKSLTKTAKPSSASLRTRTRKAQASRARTEKVVQGTHEKVMPKQRPMMGRMAAAVKKIKKPSKTNKASIAATGATLMGLGYVGMRDSNKKKPTEAKVGKNSVLRPASRKPVKPTSTKSKRVGQKVTGKGSKTITNSAGKKLANVTKEQLQASGFTSLRAYMNAWNKTGKRPTKTLKSVKPRKGSNMKVQVLK